MGNDIFQTGWNLISFVISSGWCSSGIVSGAQYTLLAHLRRAVYTECTLAAAWVKSTPKSS